MSPWMASLTDIALHVRLDDEGHVCAVSNARIGPGWIKPPPEVARDPFAHMVDENGWRLKQPVDHAEFDRRHAPRRAADDDDFVMLLRRADRGTLSNLERDQLLARIARAVL